MKRFFGIAFWVCFGLFVVDVINPSYTNAENMALMAFLCSVAKNSVDDAPEVSE